VKKIVRFDPKQTLLLHQGYCAIVVPVDHPDTENVTNTKHVVTTPVLEIQANGAFETRNSLYCPIHVM
jgi:hypothetical protein